MKKKNINNSQDVCLYFLSSSPLYFVISLAYENNCETKKNPCNIVMLCL